MNLPAKPGQPSFRFKLLAGVGFVVVCLGLFAPKLFLGNSAPQATADQSPLDPVGPPSDGSTLGGTVLKMLLGVGLVAVVCIGVARTMKKRTPPTVNPGLEVLASLPIDARCVVHLIQVADRRLLVGIDAGGVKAAVELPQGVPMPPPATQVFGPVAVNASSTPLPADVAALLGALTVSRETKAA